MIERGGWRRKREGGGERGCRSEREKERVGERERGWRREGCGWHASVLLC